MKQFILITSIVFFLCSCSLIRSKTENLVSTEITSNISAEAKITNDKNFQIIQTDGKTSLIFDNKVVKEWSHVSNENPFIWDEGCDKFTSLLDSLPRDNGGLSSEKKQKAWESLSKNEQGLCIKENLARSIKWVELDENFSEVERFFYEGSEGWLFDKKNNTLLDGLGGGNVKKIYSNSQFSGFVLENARGDTGDTAIIYNRELGKIVKNWNTDGTDVKSIINLEFINMGDLKITFKKSWPYDVIHAEESVVLNLN